MPSFGFAPFCPNVQKTVQQNPVVPDHLNKEAISGSTRNPFFFIYVHRQQHLEAARIRRSATHGGPVIRVFPAITALRRCLLKPSRSSLRLPMVLVFNRLRRTKNAAVVVVDTTNNHAIITTVKQGDSVKVKDIDKHECLVRRYSARLGFLCDILD